MGTIKQLVLTEASTPVNLAPKLDSYKDIFPLESLEWVKNT